MSSRASHTLSPPADRTPAAPRSRAWWSLDDDEAADVRDAAEVRLSIVFPVWNEESNLPALYEAVNAAVRPLGLRYELLFVDNGSTDGSLRFLRGLAASDGHVRYVSLTRNFGYQGGLLAGLAASQGQAVVTMDADLQHPPELIPRMVQLWREGVAVVYTRKRNYRLPPVRWLQVRAFYWLLAKVSGLTLSFGQSDFRLLDRRVVDEILRIPDSHRFLRGFVDWVGFEQAGLDYDVPPRHSGASKFTYLDLFGLAVDGIVTFSSVPVRWMLGLGIAVAMASGLAIALACGLGLMRVMGAEVAPLSDLTVLTAAMILAGALQIIAIGVLGEYTARIYEQSKRRPAFIVRERSDTPC